MAAGDHIPDDIVTDILLRLPSKSLLRFKSACKTWYSSISDSEFINLHFKRASQNPKILFSTGSHLRLLDNSSDPIAFPDETSPFHPLKTIGSCHGLVCLASSSVTATNNDKNHIFIWNPFTRDLKKISYWWPIRLRHNDYLHGFAYDSIHKDYILVISMNITSCLYFSFKKDCWTVIPTGIWYNSRRCSIPPTTATRPSTSLATELNGVLHWVVTPDHSYSNDPNISIITFDIARRSPGAIDNNSIKVPTRLSSSWSPRKSVVGLFEHRGCLCLYFSPPNNNGSKEIWIMEKYGDNDSWVHLLTVPNSESLPSGFDFCYAPIVCISSRDDEVIWRDDERFIRFRIKEGKFDEGIPVESYVNSASFCALDTLFSPQ